MTSVLNPFPSPHAHAITVCSVVLVLMTGCGDGTMDPSRPSGDDEIPTMHGVTPTAPTTPLAQPTGADEYFENMMPRVSPRLQRNIYDPPKKCGVGHLLGRICSPRGNRWQEGLQVNVTGVNCNNHPFERHSVTGTNGYFWIQDLPAGEHTIRLDNKSYIRNIKHVRIVDDQWTDLEDYFGKLNTCWYQNHDVNIAVLSGAYDHIDQDLSRRGTRHTFLAGDVAMTDFVVPEARSGLAILGADDPAALLEYDLLIINSGTWEMLFSNPEHAAEVAQIRRNLNTYVQSGGNVLLTDWAYPWLEQLWGDRIEFYGDADDLADPRVGLSGPVRTEVPSYELQHLFRESRTAPPVTEITLDLDSPGWAMITGLNRAQTDVLLRAKEVHATDGQIFYDVPMMVHFQPSATSGSVVYASFSWHEQEDLIEYLLDYVLYYL